MNPCTRSGGACTRRPESQKPRKNIRLEQGAYLAGDPFLLTVCTADRQDLLSQGRYGWQAFEQLLPAASSTGATLWCGVIMPDHAHLLVSAQPGKSPIDVAACFKRLVTMRVRDLGYAETLWQRRIHDRGLRHDFDGNLDAAVRYVLNNPVRLDMATLWEDWPLSYLHQDVDTRWRRVSP
jgi:putative transposase